MQDGFAEYCTEITPLAAPNFTGSRVGRVDTDAGTIGRRLPEYCIGVHDEEGFRERLPGMDWIRNYGQGRILHWSAVLRKTSISSASVVPPRGRLRQRAQAPVSAKARFEDAAPGCRIEFGRSGEWRARQP